MTDTIYHKYVQRTIFLPCNRLPWKPCHAWTRRVNTFRYPKNARKLRQVGPFNSYICYHRYYRICTLTQRTTYISGRTGTTSQPLTRSSARIRGETSSTGHYTAQHRGSPANIPLSPVPHAVAHLTPPPDRVTPNAEAEHGKGPE